jgi:hypothetical protein
MMDFRIESFLNPHLPLGGTRVDVVFSLTAAGSQPAAAARSRRIVGLLGDKSGSMDGDKVAAMKHAMRVAVDQLDATTEFFVAVFNQRATLVVPLTRADEAGRRTAHGLIQRIEAGGGTAVSGALAEARRIFLGCPGAVCQVILLTDGQNGAEDETMLRAELAAGSGLYQAHCRGVGTDWSPPQLREIAERLLGTVDMVAEPSGLAKDFQQTLAAALTKSLADVRLRLWMPRNAKLTQFKQGYPVEIDLTGKLRPVDQRAVDFPLGAWGEGTQDYAAAFQVVACAPGEQMLVCRPSIVFTDPATRTEVATPGGNVTVSWTDDASLSARIDAQVAHYSGQAEKARAIQEGLEALERQDDAVATLRLGRALQLAQDSGDGETTRRLQQVVEAVDGAPGTVRIKRDAGRVAVMDLDVGSTRTVRAKRE